MHHILFHKIFILDATLKTLLNESDGENITRNFIQSMLSTLSMEILGPLQIYGATDSSAPGWSFIQPITTSHISGHYFYEPDGSNPNIHIDIYSCREFDHENIIGVCDNSFTLNRWTASMIVREIDPQKRTTTILTGIGNTITAS